jgi:hypothetical protein
MKHEDIPSLLESVQRHASDWFASLGSRPVCATASAEELQQMLGGPLPHGGIAADLLTPILANAGMKGDPASCAATCPLDQRHALNLACVLKLSPQGFHGQAD